MTELKVNGDNEFARHSQSAFGINLNARKSSESSSISRTPQQFETVSPASEEIPYFSEQSAQAIGEKYSQSANVNPRIDILSSSSNTPRSPPLMAKTGSVNVVAPSSVFSKELNEQALFHDWQTAKPPIVMNKPSLQNVVFKQPVSVRFLRPPTPPPPGPVVIRERRLAPLPPLPPQIIRQRLPRARTPEPLVIRERPPTPPRPIKPVLIEKVLPAPPRPPRQVIIERFHEPRRPRKLIFEKWLPYAQPKRKIILEKAPDISLQPPPRNIIIEYTRPQAFMLPEYKVEGIFQADPLTYTYSPYDGELKVVEKIYDLPPPPPPAPGNMPSAIHAKLSRD